MGASNCDIYSLVEGSFLFFIHLLSWLLQKPYYTFFFCNSKHEGFTLKLVDLYEGFLLYSSHHNQLNLICRTVSWMDGWIDNFINP